MKLGEEVQLKIKKRMRYLIFITVIGLVSIHNIYSYKANDIKILSVEKSTDVGCEETQIRGACLDWMLSIDEVQLFFQLSQKITSKEKHDEYMYVPCEIKGSLSMNDSIFNYVINGGSYAEIYFKEQLTYIYGCSSKNCSKLVIMEKIGVVKN